MKRGPAVGGSFVQSVNQITGKIPLYKPSDKGDMIIRVLPALDAQGNELPWVDFESDDIQQDMDRLGDQHYNLEAVQIFVNNALHWFSAVSKETAEEGNEAAVKSPATLIANRISTMVKKGKEMRDKGYTGIREDFLPNKWGQSWISVSYMSLVQALLFTFNGEPVRDRDGNPFRYCIVNMTTSAMKDLRKKMFTARIVPTNGDKRVHSIEQSQFGDYVSCANGSFLVISRDQGSQKTEYLAQLGEQCPIEIEWARSVIRPWDEGENAVYKIPTHDEVFTALSGVLTDEMMGFGLIGTQFEPMLTPTQIELGKNVQIMERGTVEEQTQEETPAAAPSLVNTGRTQIAVPNRPGAPKAPATSAPVSRGPVVPKPPTPSAPKAPGVKMSAFPSAVNQKSAVADMEQLPHLGDKQEFFDPAAAVEEGLPTVALE